MAAPPADVPPEPPTDPTPDAQAASAPPPAERTGRAAALVATGILASRVLGLARSSVFSHFFGAGPAADAFNAALRIPNFLQNLFGEGVLSASFIPVYAGLRARGEREIADRVARRVGALLALVTAALVALGMAATPLLVASVAAGFRGATYDLAVRLVRITFPGVGLLVGSAWCLGILNSHRRFLLSYLAPVAWNVVLIGTLLGFGPSLVRQAGGDARLAVYLAWGAVVGSAAQLLVQVPTVLRVAPGVVRARAAAGDTARRVRAEVATAVRNFVPTLFGRGVVQISGYVDNSLASLVAPGAVTIFTNAQTLALLPGSLFGMSIAAASLPAMSSLSGPSDEIARRLRAQLATALARVAYFVVPSAVAFLALGDVLAGAIFRYGRFTQGDVLWVWGTLAGSAVGLLASALGRLYASAFYALREARTPVRFAVVRVALTLVLGLAAATYLPRALGLDARWGTAGLTVSSGVAGWLEFVLLRRALGARVGDVRLPAAYLARLWLAAAAAAAVGWGVRRLFAGAHPLPVAGAVCAAYGAAYLGLTVALDVGEARGLLARVRGRVGRRGR